MAIPNNLPQRSYIQGLWHLDETSGIRYDETDNHNDLSDINTVGYSSSGKISNAADFNAGASEYLSIADASQTGLDITQDLSIFCWIRPDTVANDMIVAKYNYDAVIRSYLLFIDGIGKIQGAISQNGSDVTLATSNSTIGTGSWTHVGLTYNYSGNSIQIYINGSADGSPATPATAGIYNSNQPFTIGARAATTNYNYYDGLIDEVIVWNKALTADEVAIVYNISAYSYFIPQIIMF